MKKKKFINFPIHKILNLFRFMTNLLNITYNFYNDKFLIELNLTAYTNQEYIAIEKKIINMTHYRDYDKSRKIKLLN